MGEPAGSLEPINPNKGKWTDNIDTAALGQLMGIAKEINKTVDNTIKTVAKAKIKVGKLLLEARVFFTDDAAFGLWRKQNTPIQSKQHAHYLMKVAERFADAPALIEGVNYSVLQELVLAQPDDVKWVEEQVQQGAPPTVQQVRAKVKGEPVPPRAERQATAGSGAGGGTSKRRTGPRLPVGPGLDRPPVQSPHQALNEIVQYNLPSRIKAVTEGQIKGVTGAYLILGMDPDPQCPMHSESLKAIYERWIAEADGEDETRVELAYEVVKEEFENW